MKKSREEILTLIAEINEELIGLGILKDEIKTAENKLKDASGDQKNYIIESLALKLHNFYTGCERIFEKISGDINSKVLQGIDWHKRLLKNMTLNIKGLRPQVLSKGLEREMEEYLKFRHLVRNIYGFELNEEKMIPLIKGIERIYIDFIEEMKKFISFLEDLAKS